MNPTQDQVLTGLAAHWPTIAVVVFAFFAFAWVLSFIIRKVRHLVTAAVTAAIVSGGGFEVSGVTEAISQTIHRLIGA